MQFLPLDIYRIWDLGVLFYTIEFCLIISKLLFLYKHNRTKQQDWHQKQWRYWPYSRVSVIGSCLVTYTVSSNSPFDFILHRNCWKANRAEYGNRSIARYYKSFGLILILKSHFCIKLNKHDFPCFSIGMQCYIYNL